MLTCGASVSMAIGIACGSGDGLGAVGASCTPGCWWTRGVRSEVSPNHSWISNAALRAALYWFGSSDSAISSMTTTNERAFPPPECNLGSLEQSPKQRKAFFVRDTWNWLLLVPL